MERLAFISFIMFSNLVFDFFLVLLFSLRTVNISFPLCPFLCLVLFTSLFPDYLFHLLFFLHFILTFPNHPSTYYFSLFLFLQWLFPCTPFLHRTPPVLPRSSLPSKILLTPLLPQMSSLPSSTNPPFSCSFFSPCPSSSSRPPISDMRLGVGVGLEEGCPSYKYILLCQPQP